MAKIFASARADFTQGGSRDNPESDERLEGIEKHRAYKLFNKKFLTIVAIKVKAVERLVKFNKSDVGTDSSLMAPAMGDTSGKYFPLAQEVRDAMLQLLLATLVTCGRRFHSNGESGESGQSGKSGQSGESGNSGNSGSSPRALWKPVLSHGHVLYLSCVMLIISNFCLP
ncbi:MAG: hypothetical protein K5683_00805 [Prevotella sp.]|nr:hypothetical protein [Prevotella sp.]